jgi:hypothetical protein
MKTAPNRYHCISSQAFDELENTLRMTALPAEMMTATRISQLTALPMAVFTASMTRLMDSNPCMPGTLPGRP